jgi:4-methylaminobutanoate oxidase (formaldehyde-forming)
VGQLRSSASITRVLKYSVDLYKSLAEETGLETGWKMTGCLRLATNEDRWIEYRRLATTARSFGMENDVEQCFSGSGSAGIDSYGR